MFNAVARGATALATACSGLADAIERTRAATLHAAADAARDMSPLELPAALLAEITWGITELELFIGTGALAISYLNDARAGYLHGIDQFMETLATADQAHLEKLTAAPTPASVGVELSDVEEIVGLGLAGSGWDAVQGEHPTPDSIHITPDRIVHVLDGDKTGGGHRFGTGKPGNTEFPPTWSDAEIMRNVLTVARDPTFVGPPDVRGTRILRGRVDGFVIEMIVRPSGYMVTAYPPPQPGIARNPRK